jgi:sulfonate transport system substrate-binding protein
VFSTACARDRSAVSPVRLAIGGQTQMVYLPTTLAQELGFYKEEGVEVELQDFEGGAKALQALLGGSADVVSGYYDHTIQMAADHREFVAFVTMLRYPGRIVGVTTPGSSSHMFLTFLLTKHQLSGDAVSVTAIGSGASAVAAIESGRIDAAWIGDPAFTLVKKRNPGVRILADLRTEAGTREAFGVGMYASSVLYSTSGWVNAHRDTASRLARAIVKTLAWMSTHSEEEIANRVPMKLRGEDDALYVEALKASRPIFSTDGMMTADGASAVREVLNASMPKVRDASIDLSKTYTNDLIAGR